MTRALPKRLSAKCAKRVGLRIKLGAAGLGILFLAASAVAGAPCGFHAAVRNSDLAKPRIVVVNPPGCPLQISSIDGEGVSAHSFVLGLVVVNNSLNPIDSYSIRYSEYLGQSLVGSGVGSTDMKIIGCICSNLNAGESQGTALGGERSRPSIDRVEVAVDFVEFADGTTWGPDMRRNGQRLAGIRAGAREAQAYLKGVFQFGGEHGLTSATKVEHLPLAAPEKYKDPQWKWGFRVGINAIQMRVKKALESKGSEAAAAILNQPVD